jgi:hypothetical protein
MIVKYTSCVNDYVVSIEKDYPWVSENEFFEKFNLEFVSDFESKTGITIDQGGSTNEQNFDFPDGSESASEAVRNMKKLFKIVDKKMLKTFPEI